MIRTLGLVALLSLAHPVGAQEIVKRPEAAKMLGAETVLTRIAIGSCMKETWPVPALRGVMASRPDLFLALGDNTVMRC